MNEDQLGEDRPRDDELAEEQPLDQRTAFNRGVVRPIECLTQAWELIKPNYWLIFGITVVGTLIAQAVPLGIVAGPMFCGIYICLLRTYRGAPIKFEMLFKGFDYFAQSLIATIIWMLPMMAFFIVAYIVFVVVIISAGGPGGGPPGKNAGLVIFGGMGMFYLAILLVLIAAQVITFFTYALIVDRKLTGVQAMGTSLRAAGGNLVGVIGLVLLIMLLNIAGTLVCCVGQFFVIPVHFAAQAVAYRKVFPRLDGAPPTPLPPGPEADYGPPPGSDEA
jgi:hypothetical protein